MVFTKKDRVQAKASLFDDGTEDHNGLTFSAHMLANGLGEWCFGTITLTLKRQGRAPQWYRVKWDDGSTTKIEHEHLLPMDPDLDGDHANSSDDEDNDVGVAGGTTVDDAVTDEEDGGGQALPLSDVEVDGLGARCIAIGGSVTVNDVTWTRVERIPHDTRQDAPDFDLSTRNWTIDTSTCATEAFWKCMPVSRADLLEVLRFRADAANCKYKEWRLEHVDAAIVILVGGAQYKTGTDLWAVDRRGMLEPPDFGRIMSKDRFSRVLRYWARGPEGVEYQLGIKPWGEVDWWLDGFNKSRYPLPPPPHSTPQRPHSPMLEGVIE
jgi:hypothetical protein